MPGIQCLCFKVSTAILLAAGGSTQHRAAAADEDPYHDCCQCQGGNAGAFKCSQQLCCQLLAACLDRAADEDLRRDRCQRQVGPASGAAAALGFRVALGHELCTASAAEAVQQHKQVLASEEDSQQLLAAVAPSPSACCTQQRLLDLKVLFERRALHSGGPESAKEPAAAGKDQVMKAVAVEAQQD